MIGFVWFFDIELHELFILEIHPFSVASFANIFSHSVAFPFVLLIVFFAVQRLLSLEHHLTPHTKMNSKWIKSLMVKTRYKHRQNTDINHSKIFLDLFPESNENKNKSKQMGPRFMES